MQSVVDESVLCPKPTSAGAQRAYCFAEGTLRSDGRGRRVSICRLAHAFRLSVARPDHARSKQSED